jgi:hypothetical protein
MIPEDRKTRRRTTGMAARRWTKDAQYVYQPSSRQSHPPRLLPGGIDPFAEP